MVNFVYTTEKIQIFVFTKKNNLVTFPADKIIFKNCSNIASKVIKELAKMANEFVKSSIGKQRVVIFSKSYCPYCTMAKEVSNLKFVTDMHFWNLWIIIDWHFSLQQFKLLNFDFLAIEIENMPDCNEIQDCLGEITGARSVPRVFVDGKFIGGGTDVKKLYDSGELAKMLQ